MIRFITRILFISTFFIGLGAIADRILKSVIPTRTQVVSEQKSECDRSKIEVVKIENNSSEQYQFRMILPNIDENFDEPIAQKKVKKICPRMNENERE